MYTIHYMNGSKIRIMYILSYLPWLVLLAWLANVSWFLCDDAFISFRYARNLLEGHGLVFNPGEYVEGYSNFLWVLELAAIWGLFGLRPEQAAPWLSVVCTIATIACMLWWVARTPFLHHRGLVAYIALGLLCSSATFAVWTSGGGLETRQFSFFVVLAVVFLGVYRYSHWGLLAVSLSLTAAAYTRPEGPLLAACCFVWFAFQRILSSRRLPWQELTFLVGPFVLCVAAHYLFRYGYYGEWLPNTYYAKYVRPWYESGFRYMGAAALETGLYLLLPLACLALWTRWQSYRDGTYALALLCIVAHMVYVMQVGGDHFEYRPLDFYWPLLVVPAATGLVQLGSMIASRLERIRTFERGISSPRAWALLLFVPVLFYAGAIQGILLFKGAEIRGFFTHIELNEENTGWLFAAPGMPKIVAISNDLRQKSGQQFVAIPFAAHREYAKGMLHEWKPYEAMERGRVPDDALVAEGSIGIIPYYLPDLKVIDIRGLTDATIARTLVPRANHERSMGHDRWAPPGYLEERGVNLKVFPAAFSEAQALARANYALKVGPELWMPFNADDHQWVVERFAEDTISMGRQTFRRPRPADQATGKEEVVRFEVIKEEVIRFEVINDDFERPQGVAAANGRLYIADPDAQELIVFEAGRRVARVNQSDQHFREPVDVDADAAGNIYVLDAVHGQVSVHDAAGDFVQVLSISDGIGGRARGIHVDSQGRIWLAVTSAQSVAAYDTNGQELVRFSTALNGTDLQPVDVAFHAADAVYVTVIGTRTSVLRFSEDGELLASWPLIPANSKDGPHLSLDRSGVLYVTQPEQGGVLRIAGGEDEDVSAWILPPSTPIRKIVGIAFEEAGSLVVTDSENGSIYRLPIEP